VARVNSHEGSEIQVRLLVGSPQATKDLLFEELARLFLLPPHSPQRALMHERRHPALRWVIPSGAMYRKDDVEFIFYEAYSQRATSDKLAFIFERADLLNDACANKLLKLVEEPPAGIYFFFLTPQREFVINTLASRALIQDASTPSQPGSIATAHPLVELFKRPSRPTHVLFTQTLEKQPPSEQETKFLLDELYLYWTQSWHRALESQDVPAQKNAERILKVLTYGYDRLPMPGSAKYFWRTIFLLLENKE